MEMRGSWETAGGVHQPHTTACAAVLQDAVFGGVTGPLGRSVVVTAVQQVQHGAVMTCEQLNTG